MTTPSSPSTEIVRLVDALVKATLGYSARSAPFSHLVAPVERAALLAAIGGVEKDARRWRCARRDSFNPIGIVNGDMNIVTDEEADAACDAVIDAALAQSPQNN